MKCSARKILIVLAYLALALGLSYLERFLPLQVAVPLPGVKLGLANIVTLMALYFLGTRPAVTILGLRCFLGSLFGGGLSALAFSLTGGLLALGTMTLARRIPALSVYGVSVLGAAAHNLGQICAAMVLLGSVYVISYLPFLLAVSVLTGLATGAASSASFRALLAAGQRPIPTQEVSYAGNPR